LNQIDSNEKVEGIIISGKVNKTNIATFSIKKLLAEVEEMAGCSPIAVNYFKIDEVVHLQATSSFFKTLLQHPGLYCAQAVDVSMFDM
jgi:cell division ATPase FtsA